jgi:hypothetical protein
VLGSGEPTIENQSCRKIKSQKYMIQSKLKTKTLKERAKESWGHNHKAQFEVCPECGGVVAVQEGCVLCMNCGWSVCSG